MHPHAVMCHAAPDLASLSRWAPVLPRVLQLWTSHLRQGKLRRCHVSHGTGPRLPAGEGSGAVTHPIVPCGPRASSIKKGLAGLAMQLGSRISKECSRVFKTPAPE
jgi:hypothetical protein